MKIIEILRIIKADNAGHWYTKLTSFAKHEYVCVRTRTKSGRARYKTKLYAIYGVNKHASRVNKTGNQLQIERCCVYGEYSDRSTLLRSGYVADTETILH